MPPSHDSSDDDEEERERFIKNQTILKHKHKHEHNHNQCDQERQKKKRARKHSSKDSAGAPSASDLPLPSVSVRKSIVVSDRNSIVTRLCDWSQLALASLIRNARNLSMLRVSEVAEILQGSEQDKSVLRDVAEIRVEMINDSEILTVAASGDLHNDKREKILQVILTAERDLDMLKEVSVPPPDPVLVSRIISRVNSRQPFSWDVKEHNYNLCFYNWCIKCILQISSIARQRSMTTENILRILSTHSQIGGALQEILSCKKDDRFIRDALMKNMRNTLASSDVFSLGVNRVMLDFLEMERS